MRQLWEAWPFVALAVSGYVLWPSSAPGVPPLPAGWRVAAATLLLLAVFGLLAWSSALLQRGVTWFAALWIRDYRRANGVYYFLMRPGVLMHEAAHAVAVLLMRGRITGFSAGETTPVASRAGRQGRAALLADSAPVRLGHVRYTVWGRSALALRLKDAFIGFAPLPAGIALIILVLTLGHIDPAAGWNGLVTRDWADWRLWLGLLVVVWVANQMTPSDVDRKNWPLAVLLLGAVAAVVLAGLSVANQWLAFTPPESWLAGLGDALLVLAAVLAVPVVLNVIVGGLLLGLFRLLRRG